MALANEESSRVLRASGADDMTFLLQDLAPELALRWTARLAANAGNDALSPALCRGLLSTVLRAASREDALAALDVLEATAPLRQEAPLARLGASTAVTSATLHGVLLDLLQSVITQVPLLPSGPALSFYSTAGIGSSDEAEYEGVADGSSDTRIKFRARQPPLASVRARNVCIVVGYFATILRSSPAVALEFTNTMTIDKRRSFWTLFYATLPQNITALLPDDVRAVQSLFGAAISCETEVAKLQIITELVTAFNDASLLKADGSRDRPSSALGLFARSLPSTTFRIESCVHFFVQVCKDNVRGESFVGTNFAPMNIKRFTYNFAVPLLSSNMPTSQQTSVPALLTAMAEAWMDVGTAAQFCVKFDEGADIVDALNSALGRLSGNTGTVPRDVMALRVTFLSISARVIEASKQSSPNIDDKDRSSAVPRRGRRQRSLNRK
jgi:hypothetical protein